MEGAQAALDRGPRALAGPVLRRPPRRHRALLPRPGELLRGGALLSEHAPRREPLGGHWLPVPRRRGRQRLRGPRLGAHGRPRARLQHPEHWHLRYRRLST